MKTNEQIGREAARLARKAILDEAKKAKLTTAKVLKRIAEGLDATENKVFFDKDRAKCFYSTDLINWETRSKSIDQSLVVLDMKPSEKVDLNARVELNTDTAKQKLIDRVNAITKSRATRKNIK